MILSIAKSADLPLPAAGVWAVIRRPELVAGCLAALERFEPGGPGRYDAVLVERVGPFSVQVPLAIEVTEDATARTMTATVGGQDRAGQARVRGEVRAAVRERDDGTPGATLEVTSEVEILGRLATLGAVPIRRRGDQVFEAFLGALRRLLEAGDG